MIVQQYARPDSAASWNESQPRTAQITPPFHTVPFHEAGRSTVRITAGHPLELAALRPGVRWLRLLHFGERYIRLLCQNAHNLTASATDTRHRGRNGNELGRPAGVPLKDFKETIALREQVRRYRPDVIAWQEVGDRAFMNSVNRFYLEGRYPRIVEGRRGGAGRGIHQGLMTTDKFSIEQVRHHYDTQVLATNDVSRRDFLEVVLKSPSGYKLTVFNAHFKSQWNGYNATPEAEAASNRIREQEARSAAAIVRQRLQEDPDADILVVGDFNADPDTPQGRRILETMSLPTPEAPEGLLTEITLGKGRFVDHMASRRDPDAPARSRGKPRQEKNKPAPKQEVLPFMRDTATAPPNSADPIETFPDATFRPLSKGQPPVKLDYVFASPHLLPRIERTGVVGTWEASDHKGLMVVIREPNQAKKHLSGTRSPRTSRQAENLSHEPCLS